LGGAAAHVLVLKKNIDRLASKTSGEPALASMPAMRGRQDMGGDTLSRHEAAIIWEYGQFREDRRINFANRSNKRKIVVKFKGLAQFNCEDGIREAGQRIRMGREVGGMSKIERWFGGDTLPDRLALALAKYRAIDMKEYCESFEFFTHVRRKKYGVAETIADLCCGHGFTGMLWAVFERKGEQINGKEPC
jgi:hypothetical protein